MVAQFIFFIRLSGTSSMQDTPLDSAFSAGDVFQVVFDVTKHNVLRENRVHLSPYRLGELTIHKATKYKCESVKRSKDQTAQPDNGTVTVAINVEVAVNIK